MNATFQLASRLFGLAVTTLLTGVMFLVLGAVTLGALMSPVALVVEAGFAFGEGRWGVGLAFLFPATVIVGLVAVLAGRLRR